VWVQGDDYILYCHPSRQKTPRSEHLREWYLRMLRHSQSEGVVTHLSNLYDTFFEGGRDHRVERPSATHLPYFEGARSCSLLTHFGRRPDSLGASCATCCIWVMSAGEAHSSLLQAWGILWIVSPFALSHPSAPSMCHLLLSEEMMFKAVSAGYSGDYWPGEAESLLANISEEARLAGKKGSKPARTAKNTKGKRYGSGPATTDAQLMEKLGDTIMGMKADFIVVHLQEPCSFCRNYISDATRCTALPCAVGSASDMAVSKLSFARALRRHLMSPALSSFDSVLSL
jgi:hypothetical protein